MSEVETNVYAGEFSLAELSEMNTDEIKSLKSRLPLAGIWTVLMTAVSLGQLDAKPEEDKAAVPYVIHKFESISIEPQKKDPDLDPDSLVGRKLTRQTMLWTSTRQAFLDEIAYLKGNYEKVGYKTEGKLGGMTEAEGEPGWLDMPVINEIPCKLRVRHGMRQGNEVAYIDWLGPVEEIKESEGASA
jgi:hypothetical protein